MTEPATTCPDCAHPLEHHDPLGCTWYEPETREECPCQHYDPPPARLVDYELPPP
jgi:hypothetical protein